MKKLIPVILAAVLTGCSSPLRKADFELPENWQAAVTVTDMKNKTGRAVFLDENGETGSVSIDLPLADTEHPLPETDEYVWLVPGYDMKDFRPARTLYRFSRRTNEADLLKTDPSQYTAAADSKALYFAHTDPGSPPVSIIDRLDFETMKKTSLEYEDRIVMGLAASENGVCLLSEKAGNGLTAGFYERWLGEKMEVSLLEDTAGNIAYCTENGKMYVIVHHMEGNSQYRTLFILEPDTASVTKIEMSFSKDGIPFGQDAEHILIVEAMERNDVLITRMNTGTRVSEEYIFNGSFRTLTADKDRIYLIDQDQRVHVLDGQDPSRELNQFEIAHNEHEYVRAAFSRN